MLERDEENERFKDYQDFVIHNAEKVSISFSPNGKWMAIFRLGLNKLKIYNIEN